MRKLDARQIAREKSTFRYSSALERGDFSTVEMILQEAEHDPLLAQMIAEINMVYENELIRLSPPNSRLNSSTNHHRKDLLMTTITLPAPQRQSQRWLPFTLVAACLSVLFIGALMLRPNPNDNSLAGIQGRPSETPTALPTLIPTLTATPFPAVMDDGTALPPTVVPPADTINPVFIGANTCKITTDTNVQVFTRPEGMVLEHLEPSMIVVVIDSQQLPNTGETWDYIMTAAYGTTLQGWVNSRLLQPFECPSVPEPVIGVPTAFPPTLVPPSDVGTVSAVPDTNIPLATIVPADATLPMPAFVATPTAYFDNIMRDNPPAIILTQSVGSIAANTKVQITMASYDGTQWTYQIRSNDGALEMIKEADLIKLLRVTTNNTVDVSGSNCTVVNTSDDSVPVYSGPSSDARESLLVNNLAPNTPAQLLYKQTGSDGSTWYLVLAVLDGGKQVSGWVSADGVQLIGQNCHTTR